VQFYFRDIRPVSSLLTLDEERSMAAEVQAGKQARLRLQRNPSITGDERARLESAAGTGLSARQKLIIANTRLVVSIARVYQGRGFVAGGFDPGRQSWADEGGGSF